MWLGLLLSLAFIPGWTGVAIPTGWAALSLTLPWLVWRRVEMTPLHYLGLVFLAYALLSFEWAPRREDGVFEFWRWTLFAFAFLYGQQHSLRPLWRGLAIGCGISSAVAIAQWWGWEGIANLDWNKWAGLHYNNAVAGAVAAIVIIGLLTEGMLIEILPVMPMLILAGSRGAWLAVVGTWIASGIVGSESWKDRFFILFFMIAPVIAALMWYNSESDFIRLEIWKVMYAHFSPFGAGIGASQSIYMATPNQIYHIEHAHNDYINLLYQYGIGVLPLIPFLWLLLEARYARTWSPLVCGLILALYFWTLESPLTGFLLAVVAGRTAGELAVAWHYGIGRGLGGLLCNEAWGSGSGATSRGTVPV